jgi:DNA polymerase-3 subunit alpha/error-prone DNA polymerase
MYLNCHSYHSLRYGTIPVDELVAIAASAGVTAMALTDINTVTGVYEFFRECKSRNIHPLVGMEMRNEGQLCYVMIAKNNKGFAEICRLRTKYNFSKEHMPAVAPEMQDVFVIYPFELAPSTLRENEFVGLRPEQVNKLVNKSWRHHISRMVIFQPVTIRSKKEFELHRILRAVDMNIILSKLGENDHCRYTEQMVSPERLLRCYEQYPEIIANTESILSSCNFEFDFKAPKNKKHYTNSRNSDRLLLGNLAREGFHRRYRPDNKEALARVEKELEVIDKMGFAGYFLITWDIIRYSTSRGFLHIGRGSGANSIVSYCLGITDICPIELDLYFERFLNPGRSSPPDFDIDWSWKDRDEILDYIFKRFDTNHVAFTGTIGEFKYRSIIRELGKVFGLPKQELDALAGSSMAVHDKSAVVRQIHEYGLMLEKFPNMRSMHSCGILISEEPITNYTALEMPPKGFPVVQFDMHIAEDIGFEKFDILSQRGIGHINDSVKLIEKNQGIKVDIRDVRISKDEAKANEYLKIGKTLGCFYIESPAMRGLMRRLKCDSYKVLVAASSVIRPGVAQSGMMREYVFRHNHPGSFEYFHPVFEKHLGETYGVMVYQEDVIKIAHHFAGLDLSDADILRRAMSGKTRSRKEFLGVRDRFFSNCKEKKIPDELAAEVYRQIESFAGYSFCKAHSASYAVESYQSLYLKVYYPIEFMVAVINNFGGFYRTEVYVHEARMAGANICLPCVNRSEYQSTVYGKDVFLGLIHIENLEAKLGNFIPEERMRNGDYLSLEDFISRVPAGIETLQILIFTGAFRFTGKSKNELILAARMLLASFKPEQRVPMLISEPVKEYSLPALERQPFEDAFDEIELLGFPVSYSPFELLRTKFRGDVMSKQLPDLDGHTVRMIGYLISRKHVPTKAGLMNFATWIDAEGEYFDTTHFADCLERFPFLGGGCYLLLGKVDVDYGFPSIVIERMAKLPFVADPRYSDDPDQKKKIQERMREDVSVTHRAPYPSESEINLPRHKMKEAHDESQPLL